MNKDLIDKKTLLNDLKEKVYPEKYGERCNTLDVIGGVLQVIGEQQTIDVENMLVCNCKCCKNDNTDECMHCMRAYTDCYEE